MSNVLLSGGISAAQTKSKIKCYMHTNHSATYVLWSFRLSCDMKTLSAELSISLRKENVVSLNSKLCLNRFSNWHTDVFEVGLARAVNFTLLRGSQIIQFLSLIHYDVWKYKQQTQWKQIKDRTNSAARWVKWCESSYRTEETRPSNQQLDLSCMPKTCSDRDWPANTTQLHFHSCPSSVTVEARTH